MDDRRFDRLTKALGAGGSRRRLLKGLLGLGGAAISGAAFSVETGAARRPASTPTPRPTCPGQQTWSNGACACPGGLATCGPACCNPTGTGAEYSECCDNECCFGTCYGEERCCPYPRELCPVSGECCPEGWSCCPGYGCISPEQCCTDEDCTQHPNSVCDTSAALCSCTPSTCETLGNVCGAFEDGCGSYIECACTAPQICSNTFCVNSGAICPAGQSYCGESAQCANEICFCFPGTDGDLYCIKGFEEPFGNCGECSTNSDCVSLLDDPRSVCVIFDVDCDTCTGSGACAPLCERN